MIGGSDVSAAVRASAREMLATQDRRGRKANKRQKAKAKRRSESTMKYLIETHGCQMNVHDSERMAGLLEQAGYEPTADDSDADVIVINTCSVRERAEEKLFTRLGEIRQQGLERGTRPIVAVAGCVAQQEGEQILARSSAVDVIVGTQNIKRLPMLVEQAATRRRRHAAARRHRSARRRLVPARRRAARRSVQGLRHHHRRVQRVLRLLRRAVHARPRAHAPGRGHRRRGAAGGRRGRASRFSSSGRSSTTTRRPTTRRATSRRCSSGSTRSRASSASGSPARIRATSRRA